MHINPAHFGNGDNGAPNDLYRKYNYELCEAIDLTKLAIVLGKMVDSGHLNDQLAKIFEAQGAALLAALRTENNRAFGK